MRFVTIVKPTEETNKETTEETNLKESYKQKNIRLWNTASSALSEFENVIALLDNYAKVDSEPYKTMINDYKLYMPKYKTDLETLFSKVYKYNARLFFKKPAKELEQLYSNIINIIDLINKITESLYQRLFHLIKTKAKWKTKEPITLSKIWLKIYEALLSFNDSEDKLKSYDNTVHTNRDTVVTIVEELEKLLETNSSLSLNQLNQLELNEINSNVEVKLDEIITITNNIVKEVEKIQKETSIDNTEDDSQTQINKPIRQERSVLDVIDDERRPGTRKLLKDLITQERQFITQRRQSYRRSSRSPDAIIDGVSLTAGGKKSKKRRTQSKQTKRRQRKISKKSKIKYTIRRRKVITFSSN